MLQYHTPVLLEESVGLLGIDPAGTYVDLTFGGGGHSRRILEELGPEGRLYAFDQIAIRSRTPPMTGGSATWRAISVSARSPSGCAGSGGGRHSGRPGRLVAPFRCRGTGFFVRGDAPLDMRMNQRGRLTAADVVVNSYPAQTLTQLLGTGASWDAVEGRQLHRPGA